MPLTPAQAADVARRHGLTLQDAAALRSLADDVDEADAVAAKFSNSARKAQEIADDILGYGSL